jgi:hypothetical protein
VGGVSESIAGGEPQDAEARDAELVDVGGEPLSSLLTARRDSPVRRSMARIQRDLADPNGVLSAFSSFIDGS